MLTVGHVDSLEHGGTLAAAFRLRNPKAERFLGGLGLLDLVHALDLLQLALGLRCF